MSDAESDRIEDDVVRLIRGAASAQRPDAAFAARLHSALVAEGGARSSGFRRRVFRAAVAAALAALALLGGRAAFRAAESSPVWTRAMNGARVVASRSVAADAPHDLWVDGAGRGRIRIEGVAELELSDFAAALFEPAAAGLRPRLTIAAGTVEAVVRSELEILAAGVVLVAHPGADVVSTVVLRSEATMKSEVLSAIGGAALGAACVGFFLKDGSADLKMPDNDAAALARGRATVIDRPASEEAAATRAAALLAAEKLASGVRDDLARAKRKIAELENDVAAAKNEARELRDAKNEGKAVEIGAVLARIQSLKEKGLSSLLDPKALSDVVTDLKALGPAGIQAMVAQLQGGDKESRFMAAHILESLGDPASIDALKAASIADDDDMVTAQASHAIALMNHESVTEACREIYGKAKGEAAKLNSLYGWAKDGDAAGMAEAMNWLRTTKAPESLKKAIGHGFLLAPDGRAMPVADAWVELSRADAGTMQLAVQYYLRAASPAAMDRLRSIADDPRVPQVARDAARAALAK